MDCVLMDKMPTVTKIEKRNPPNGAKTHVVRKHHVLDTLLTQIHGATLLITISLTFQLFRSFKAGLATKKFQVFSTQFVLMDHAYISDPLGNTGYHPRI